VLLKNRANICLIIKKSGMLEHQKMIIKNVSQCSDLFKKEIQKSIKWLKVSELILLFEWLKENFWQTNQKDIEEILYTI
jgi:hypothetical protein